MKIFRKKKFFLNHLKKIELSYVFTINMFSAAENCKEKWINLLKNRCFSIIGNYLRPSNNSRQLIFNINAVILLRFTKMVKCLPEFEYFYCILEK